MGDVIKFPEGGRNTPPDRSGTPARIVPLPSAVEEYTHQDAKSGKMPSGNFPSIDGGVDRSAESRKFKVKKEGRSVVLSRYFAATKNLTREPYQVMRMNPGDEKSGSCLICSGEIKSHHDGRLLFKNTGSPTATAAGERHKYTFWNAIHSNVGHCLAEMESQGR